MVKKIGLGLVLLLIFLLVATAAAQVAEDAPTVALVSDIYPGTTGAYPQYLTVYNGKLYFSANGNNGYGQELWVYDGISSPFTITDIETGGSSSYPQDLVVFNNKLYFSAFQTGLGYELWEWNGGTYSLVKDIWTGSSGSAPSGMTVFNGALYFSADGGGGTGVELWKYTGSGDPVRMTDINPGSGSSDPSHFAVFNNKLYFRANDGSHGYELWVWNGSAAFMVKDIYSGAASSSPFELTVYDGALYFSADGGGSTGVELWKYTGSGDPVRVTDIYPGIGGSVPIDLVVFKDKLYFNATDPTYGDELWVWDGSNASLVKDIWSGTSSANPLDMTVFLGSMYFSADGGGGTGKELWKYSGSGDPVRVTDINPGSGHSYPGDLVVYNNKLYFRAGDGTHGDELWSFSYPLHKDMFYSQAPYDGWVLESAENSNTGGLINTTNLTCYIGDDALNRQYRTILHFNTSRIPDGAVVAQSSLQIKRHSIIGGNPLITHGKIWADIKEGFYSNNPALVQSDFAAGSSLNFAGSFTFVPSGLAYPIYRASLKSDALESINLTGITQFRLRFATDDDNDHTADYWKVFCGDMGVPFNRPVLRVWYIVP